MKLPIRLLIAGLIALLTGLLCISPFVEQFDRYITDRVTRLLPRSKPPSNVIVVAIDEPSYKELGVGFDKPWPRELHAKLLRRLKELGAARVAFDVLFTGPSSQPGVDQELIDAFSGIPSVIGVEANNKTILTQGRPIIIEEVDQPHEPFRKVTTQALVNLDMITDNGFIRSFPFYTSDQTKRYPFLAYAAAGLPDAPGIRYPDIEDMIKYYGPARQNARIVSYWTMFEKMAPQEAASFKDAVIFVGLLLRTDTGVAQKDSYFSPLGGDMIFGIEVHAAIAGNLLQQSWITRPPRGFEVIIQSLTAGGVALTATSLSPIGLALIVAGIIVLWAVSSLGLAYSGVFLAGASVMLLLLGILLVSAVVSYVGVRRSERALQSAFSLYVSPDMVRKLQQDKSALRLGGEKLWITAMFTDIADFTTISEEMPAEDCCEMLNAYFTEVMEVVFANQGTLLKFIGDAIFAIWGAPVKIPNHAEVAIKTGLAIQKGVERFNASKRYPPLITRIGIHTGPMLVGNLGSVRRQEYTAIGDSVNLSSRIEGLNKYLGTSLLFTEATRRDAGGVPDSLPIATVRVKGRREPVELFSLFDPVIPREIAGTWRHALQHFRKTSFDAALPLFEQVAAAESRLATSAQLHIKHIKIFQQTPPSTGWDGEIDFDAK